MIEKISSQVRTVTSQELDDLIDRLLDKIKLSGFSPDFLVYLETGARQPAAIFFEKTQIPLIPLTIQRPGKIAKNKVGKWLNFLPLTILNFLRTIEAIFVAPLLNRREIISPPTVNLRGKKILIFDDASDSGQSLILAKDWVFRKEASEIKTAAITVTTVKAQQLVDYFVYLQPCRFPWSLDAAEKVPAQSL